MFLPHLLCFYDSTGDLYYVRYVIVLVYWWNCNYIVDMCIYTSVVYCIGVGVYMYTVNKCNCIGVTNACSSLVLYMYIYTTLICDISILLSCVADLSWSFSLRTLQSAYRLHHSMDNLVVAVFICVC